jgi:hypothetical protein
MSLFGRQDNSIQFEVMLGLSKFYSSDIFMLEAANGQELCTDWIMIEGF